MQRDHLLLEEIIASAQRACDIASQHSIESLITELDARDALLWNLTVVGEAVSQLSESVKASHPGIPWSQPVRMRNRIVHGYWSVDLDVIYVVASKDLPDFVRSLQVVVTSI